ncbi:peptide ABC transporter permease [Shouchella clausii]|uniref:oligopeptide ABC transporter permease n=1 Tax=Shouchella clausii TaxID=79880 RepID=UPI000BA63A68|nr:oligopeptide ABC transporter permease [Shouchella clausii]MBU8596704.1 ABC transporter permease [Shouchella clausii]PAD07576.1 peptide ABC transporter permease [Shouchella clausii]PAD90160.1 peptide ABC transporter permease [Shouchella clausii]PAE78871.1 peptide ABC transporter permease [Shouchella clausii]PAF03687.1 peptide ABC transporter permease [Shouchella clausii]
MWKFIVRRILVSIPQIFVLSLLVFIMAQFMPGDALTGLINDPDITPEAMQAQREKLGLDNPWYIQYKDWIINAVQGDLGKSFSHKIPVTELIDQRIWNTIWLALLSLVFIYAIAVPLGILSGRYNDTLLDKTITGYTYVGFAAPTFIFGLVMVFFFGFKLQWFPTGGSVAPGLEPGTWEYVVSKLQHLLLPALSIALIGTVSTVQYLRSEIIDTKQKDFIKLARSKGVYESRIYNKHVFRNSLLPVAALIGFEVSSLVTGSIFIEAIFNYPGMGQLFFQSILIRDYSVVTALVLLFGVIMILGALLSDIIMSIIDPRIRIK